MFIPRIAITGHRPDGFSNKSYAEKLCYDVIYYCRATYHGVEFNLGGALGTDAWAAKACISSETDFHLYMPFPASKMTQGWSRKECQFLTACALAAKTTHVSGDYFSNHFYQKRNEAMVNDAHLVICFWEGARRGGTYNTIKYAIKNGVQVLNAMNELEEVKI